MPALERTTSFHDASKARAAFERRQAVAVAQLEHEEAELEPVYLEKKDAPEIKAMGRAFGKVPCPGRPGRSFAWVTDGASPEEMAAVFDRYRVPLYQQASNKPYAIAAMIFLQKIKDPAAKLHELWDRDLPRWAR